MIERFKPETSNEKREKKLIAAIKTKPRVFIVQPKTRIPITPKKADGQVIPLRKNAKRMASASRRKSA